MSQKEQTRKYREKNREKLRTKAREFGRANPRVIKDRWLRRLYGINIATYDLMYENQRGCCAICGRHRSEFRRDLAVDHAHNDTKKVRGLLCGSCNSGVGKLQDNPEILQKAIDYLNKS